MTSIRELRQTKGWTQRELAAMAGLSLRAVAHHEAQTKEPNPQSIQAYAYALGVSVEELYGYKVYREIEWRSDRNA